MNAKEKEEILTFYDLRKRVFGKTSGTLCHYTSYESLLMILKNRSFRLSRYDLLNDIAEKELSKCGKEECRYIMSFTGTTKENVAMWALYGKHSSLKLRLEFSRSHLIQSSNDNFYFDSERKNKIPVCEKKSVPADFSKRDFSLSDVVYYDREKNVFRFSGRPLNKIPVSENELKTLAGTIKYDAWEYEREARLAIVIHNSDNAQFQNLNCIYAGLSEEFIKKLTITYSPWINDTMYEVLKASIDNIAGYKLKHKKSSLQGQVGEL